MRNSASVVEGRIELLGMDRMPPACPVDRYVPCYSGQHRSQLQCHRLARWIVTFLAAADSIEASCNATGLPGGSLRSLLQRTASKPAAMPPACPVDRYVPCYSGQHPSQLQCHRLARWIVTFLATADSIETSCNAHRLARWIVTFLATGSGERKYPPGKPVALEVVLVGAGV